MKRRSGNRIIAWALGISIAVHVAFAIAVHNMQPVEAAPEQPPQQTFIVHIPPPTPTPRPAPSRPPHVTAPAQAPSHHVLTAPHVVQQSGTHAGPAGPVATSGPVVADVSPAPGTPGSSPHPACSNPNEPAHTLSVVAPEQPEDATNLPATAQIEVTLDAAGRVVDATIYHSTNEMALDRAALVAARKTTYSPATVDCVPTGGSYLFRVDFQQ
jgi:TonB family protein